MFNRNVSLAVCVCLALTRATFAQSNPGTSYLFQIPGSNSPGKFYGYLSNANPFINSIAGTGPSGLLQILPKPDGTQFYLLGNTGTTALQSVDPTFTKFASLNGLDLTPTALSMTEDGRYLLVGTDGLYIIDTATNTVPAMPIQLPGAPSNASGYTGPPCPSCWIVSNRDSSRVYVLTNSSFGSQVSAYNPATKQFLGSMSLPFGGAIAIAISPLGLLYVTAPDRIYEINGDTLSLTAKTGTLGINNGVVASLSQLQFSQDGTVAYAINTNPSIGQVSLGQVSFLSSPPSYTPWPSKSTGNPVPVFDDLIVVGANRAFAHDSGKLSDGSTSQNSGLWDISGSPFVAGCATCGQAQSTLFKILPAQNTIVMAASNEVPSSLFLFLLVKNGNQTNLYRVNLTTNQADIVNQVPASDTGAMLFVAVPPESGAAGFLKFNDNQTVQPGAKSVPLIARIINGTGQPVFNASATFSTDPVSAAAGLVIAPPAVTSNADGYVATTITAPPATSAPVNYAVTLTAGAATVNFTVTVPGTGGGGGNGNGNGNGPSQVTIVGGNGQLVEENQHTLITNPLTILVTDTKGNPLPHVAVTFAVTGGVGLVTNPNPVTDKNGLASTDFFGEAVQGFSYQTNTVTANTAYGSVNFTVTTFHLNLNGTGYPETSILTPTLASGPTGYTVYAGLGTPLPNAITAKINAGAGTGTDAPLVGVGLFTYDPNDPTQSPANAPAQCQGSSLSDASGIAHCTLLAVCSTTVGTHRMEVSIGGLNAFAVALVVTAGSPSAFTVLSGNNQSGTAGQVLPATLLALVNDGCGNPLPGVVVTWAVTQGSATLSSTVNTSDSAGRVSTKVTLGQTPGPVTVTLSIAKVVQQVFTLTNKVVVNSVTASSGNNQTATTGGNFPQVVSFLVKDVDGNIVVGIPVAFAVTTGSAGVSPATANTDSTGTASTTVSAGVPAGPIIITATAAGVSGSAFLTSIPPGPLLTPSSFSNSASFTVGLVPCGLATVIGTGLAPGLQGVVSGLNLFGPLPFTLNGLTITVNGSQAPIESVSNQGGKEQATFQTPCEVSPGTATVIVQISGASTTVPNVQVFQGQPGIFTYQGANGKLYGAVVRPNGSYVTPDNFAQRGETCYLIATGLGQTNPPTATDSAGIAGQTVALPITVSIDNTPVPVVAGQSLYLQGSIGVYIVGFQIPFTALTGPDLPFQMAVTINGQNVLGNSIFLPGIQ